MTDHTTTMPFIEWLKITCKTDNEILAMLGSLEGAVARSFPQMIERFNVFKTLVISVNESKIIIIPSWGDFDGQTLTAKACFSEQEVNSDTASLVVSTCFFNIGCQLLPQTNRLFTLMHDNYYFNRNFSISDELEEPELVQIRSNMFPLHEVNKYLNVTD